MSQVVSNLSQIDQSSTVGLIWLPNLRGDLPLIVGLYFQLLIPLNEAWRSPHRGLAIDNTGILRIVDIVSELINVENTLWDLIWFLEDHTVLLKVHVVPNDWGRFKLFKTIEVWGMLLDHPGRGQLGGVSYVNLRVFFIGVLSIQSISIHSQPAICLTNNGDRRGFHGTSFSVKMSYFSWLLLRRLPLNPHVIGRRILIKLVPIDL